MNIENIVLETKCPDLKSLLRAKDLFKDEYFKLAQEVQIAVNHAVNFIRKALMKGHTAVVISMDKYNNGTNARILAKQVLANHGYKFLDPDQSDNRQFEYWKIDLSA